MGGPKLALLLLALSVVVGRAQAASILFVTLPGGMSHHMQSLALARSLAARNHTAHLLLPDYDLAALQKRGRLGDWVTPIAFPTPPGTDDDFQELVRAFADRPRDFMPLHLAHFHGMCRLVLSRADILAQLRAAAYDAIVSDNTFQCGFVLADLLGLRRIDLSPTHIVDPFWSRYHGLFYSPALHPFIGSGLAAPMTFVERAISELLSPLVFQFGSRLALQSARRLASEFNLTQPGSMAEAHAKAVLLLVNEGPGLGTPRSLPTTVQMVGPLLLGAEPQPLPSELEAVVQAAGDAGLAYLSFGTAFRPGNCGLVRGLAGALAALAPMHAVWAIDASHFPAECPLGSLGLPPSVHVLPWVPQTDLLAHPATKVFVSHAGLNRREGRVYESAWNGRPMVCLPQTADHPDACAKAVKGGWGLRADSRTLQASHAAELAAKIARVATDPSFASKAAAVGAILKAHPRPAAERAADAIEWALALPAGADLRDPAASMPWWQWHCLDVYAAAAVVLAALLALAWRVVRAAWRAARRATGPRSKAD